MDLYARVAVPRPIHDTFLYRVPESLQRDVRPGSRVVVGFGRKELTGWVDEITDRPADAPPRIRDVLDAPDDEPVLDPDLLELCRWTARYYIAPLGLAFRAALPAGLTAESSRRLALRNDGTGASSPDGVEQKLLTWLRERQGPVKLRSARRALGPGPWSRAARRLAERGVIEIEEEGPLVEPPARTRQVACLRREIPSLQMRDRVFGRAPRQRELYEYLESVGGRAEVVHLTERLGLSRSVVHGLVEKGLAQIREEPVVPDVLTEPVPEAAPIRPTQGQREIIDRLIAASDRPEPGVFLLRGVTSSGKTLVYIELLRELVGRRGKGAIVLVPEIALTPQTLARFRAAFGDQVALLHSALSEGERYQNWQALRSGAKRIVIGARSAVFAPVQNLGAVILDEEHEGSYKQSDAAPRYHAREVAVVRARRANAICLLGSATPSLESWHNARTGKWELLELPERIGARPLPPVHVLDLRAERKRDGDGRRQGPLVLSEPLQNALRERLGRHEQAILLLNRRGYAAFVQCRACGSVRSCRDCNVSLTHHRRPPRLICHYCGYEERVPDACQACGSTDLDHRGLGTEQVERVLSETFPAARITRMDVDTTSGKWSHHDILRRVERREVDILLGTQMIAKGLDFPHVTLVGVINADVGLNLPDFRASERTFQLLTQVAGRAGRGPTGGEVFIQTALPGHYSIEFAVAHDFPGFAAREMEEREAPIYPPHTRLANITLTGPDEIAVQESAEAAVRWIDGLLRTHALEQLVPIGPAPCPIDRIRNRWRWHLLLKSAAPAALGQVLEYFSRNFEAPSRDVRIEIDRDPMSLL